MPDTTQSLPGQILETSQAFTQTLQMENIVFQEQLEGIVRMTVNALQKLILLCKDAVTIENGQYDAQLTETITNLKQASADIQHPTENANAAAPALPEDPADAAPGSVEQGLDAAVLASVALSYKNAVAAQQQAYITQQAAATMIVTTLVSITTAALSKAVQEALTKASA